MQTAAQKRATSNYVKRRRKNGMKRLMIWVTPHEEAALRGFLDALRMQQANKNKEAA